MSTKPGQKGSLWSCCSSGGSPSAQRGTAAGVFSAHGTGWCTENTAGAGHCNVLQCSSLCYTHPLLSILALPLTIAQSVAPLSLSPPSEPSRVCPAFPSLSAFFLLFTPPRTSFTPQTWLTFRGESMPSWPVYRYTSTLNSCNSVELSCISSFRITFFSSECLGVSANHSGRVTAVIAVLCSMHHPLQGHMKRPSRTVWGSGCHAQRMSNDEVSSCSSFPKLHKICRKAFHMCTCVRRHNMDFWISP